MHTDEKRWEQVVEEQTNILYQVDPVAKSCYPAFAESFIESNEYGPSFNSTTQADVVNFNILYRLGEIYVNIYRLNEAFRNILNHFDYDGSDKDIIDYSVAAKNLGHLFGL